MKNGIEMNNKGYKLTFKGNANVHKGADIIAVANIIKGIEKGEKMFYSEIEEQLLNKVPMSLISIVAEILDCRYIRDWNYIPGQNYLIR